MRHLLLVSTALLVLAGTAQAQNGSNNGNGNTGFFNGNLNGNGAGNGAGVGIGVGMGGTASAQAQGGSASAQGGKASASNSTTFKNKQQAPGLGLAGLAMGGLSCKGSASFGLSLPGGAGGVGFPVDDDECERRQWAGMLASARDPRTRALAWAIMQRSRIVQQAMEDTGIGLAVISPGPYPVAPGVRGGSVRVTAAGGCTKWSGGSTGAGVCIY